MSTAVAHKAYLAAVCPGNNAIDAADHLVVAPKYTYQLNVAKIRAASRTVVTRLRAEYLALTQPTLPWPANIRTDIGTIADSMLGWVDQYQGLADSTTRTAIVNTWNAMPNGDPPKVRKAVQRVRLLLGLPPSGAGKSGC
jgi:hypothetical protein